jgi:hypothetical protein
MRRFLTYFSVSLALGGSASAQNILTNGGFEYGLMCYLNNVWTNTGIFGLGDYKITLSTDSHSGKYSLEMNCTGTDCVKAAIISSRIPTAPNQDYSLSVWLKCPVGGFSGVYLPDATTPVFQPVNCTGDWTQAVVPFSTTATATDFSYSLYTFASSGGNWGLWDDVVLTYGDGTVPPSTTLHAGNRNVSVSGNAVQVDGSPYLALGFFDVAYSDIQQVASLGANTIFGLGVSEHAGCFNTAQKGYLDTAYENGLNFVPDSSTTMRLGVPGVMSAVMQFYAPHKANIAWLLADEPDQTLVNFWYTDPTVFVSESSSAKTQTTLPFLADFQRASFSSPSDVAPYTPGVDLFMAEPFGASFGGVNHATNLFSTMPPARPVWISQDSQSPNIVIPKAYWALVNGVTGIGYFSWLGIKTQPDTLAAIQQVFSEIGQLKNVVFAQNLDSLVTATGGVGYNVRYSGNSAYILAVNPAGSPVQSTFQLAGLVQGQPIQVMFENRTILASAGGFTDNFAGPDRHVYVIKTPATAIAGTLLSKAGSVSARDWKFQVINSGLEPLTGAGVSGIVFKQTGGTVCTPQVAPGTLPVIAGDLAPSASATADVIISFAGCDATSKFTVTTAISANGGAVKTSFVRNNERE